MNASITTRRHHVTYTLLAALSLFLTAATGCQQPFSDLSLEALASAPLTTQQQRARDDALSGVAVYCYQESDLATAAATLERANLSAESDPVAFSVQAGVIARLYFRAAFPDTHPRWLTPRLRTALTTTFEQADRRLERDPPDVATAMVWARTATTLDKQDDIERLLSRAASDPALQQALTADNPTRTILLDYARRRSTADHHIESAFLDVPSPWHEFSTSALQIAAIPPYPACVATTTVIWEYLVLQSKLQRLTEQPPPSRTRYTPPTGQPDTRSTDRASAPAADATATQSTLPQAQPAEATPPR